MAEVITVSALNRYVKTLLDANDALFDLALRGEIANFVQNARSGHCYFSLRDDVCSVKAVMFRTDARRLAFRPEEGMRVVVRCRATLYERDGAFQLYVNDMFPDGIGAAQLALEHHGWCECTSSIVVEIQESLVARLSEPVGIVACMVTYSKHTIGVSCL